MPWGVPQKPVWKSKHCWCPRERNLREFLCSVPGEACRDSRLGLRPGCGCVAGILTPGAIQPPLTPTMPSSRPGEREEGVAGPNFRGAMETGRPLVNQDAILGVCVSPGDHPIPPFVDGAHHALQVPRFTTPHSRSSEDILRVRINRTGSRVMWGNRCL